MFEGRAAAFAIGTISLGRDGAVPEQFDGLYVSADTFTVLRVAPVIGRDFSAADDRPGAEAVALVASNVWKSRYGASRDVLGRKVSVNGTTPATIIGVMSDGFHFVDTTDVWLPLSQMPGSTRQRRDTRGLLMIGRLPDSLGLDRVRAELSPIAANLAVTHPETNKDVRPLVNSFYEAYNGGGLLTDSLTLLELLIAALVLLIASANLANLLLARAAARSREIAIRVAMGATRWRIVRQLLIESLLLAFVAWVLAVGGSWLALKLSTSHVDLPYWRLKMDVRLVGMLAAVALLTTGLFGLAPALHASRRGIADGLTEGGRMSATLKTRRWTHALLVAQFALSAGAPERRRPDGQGVLQDLCPGPQCADDGCGRDVRSTAAAGVRDARAACRLPSAAAGSVAGGSRDYGERRRERGAFLARWQAPADRRGWTARERSASGYQDGGRRAGILSHRSPRSCPG